MHIIEDANHMSLYDVQMRIGILGSGLIGGKPGTVFARAGHEVVFSYSRSRQKLERLAKDAGKNARVGTPANAARDTDVLLLAVHWTRLDDVLAQAGTLSGKVLLTCSLPMSQDDSHMVIGHNISGAEAFAAKVSGAHVVSAFSTVPGRARYSSKSHHRRASLVSRWTVHCSSCGGKAVGISVHRTVFA